MNARRKKESFLNDLTNIVQEAPFTLIAPVIQKDALPRKYAHPGNPYHMAMAFGLERAFKFLRNMEQNDKITHVVFEKRGNREDNDLELEFRRVCDGANWFGSHLPFDIVFASKKINSGGLQFADLVARPVGLSILRPEQQNRAFNVLKRKFYCDSKGNRNGWGLKCFP